MTSVVDWGLREYDASLAAMRALRSARRREEVPDTLILVEHPPVITVGVQGTGGEEFPTGLRVVPVERGGKATYHGPGQLVGYPIVDLEPRHRDVRQFVTDVEEVVVRSLAEFGLHAGRVPRRRGVWVEGTRKIASVGIAVEEWVTFHGFALNVTTDLVAFSGFHPCGFDAAVMTSMREELGRDVPLPEVAGAVERAWHQIFDDAVIPAGSAAPFLSPSNAAAR
ncbi:MAG: lipoyl(octanoyl) transferase LipB [Thermoplasmata archaeon]